jgi:hypothetical protein
MFESASLLSIKATHLLQAHYIGVELFNRMA